MIKKMACLMVVLFSVAAVAQAAPAKKKGKRRSKSAVVRKKAPARSSAVETKEFIGGSNLYGRTGFLYTETAQVIREKKASGTAHLTFGEGDDVDVMSLPLGANYGIAPNMEIAGSLEYLSVDTPAGDADGLGYLSVSGKYVFPATEAGRPDFAALAEISHGPIEKDFGDDGNDFTLKGLATHYLSDGLLLNGGVGLLFVGSRDGQDSDTVFQLEGGVGVPFTPTLCGIMELAVNRFGDDAGMFSLGVRGKATPKVRWQALLGFGVGKDSPDMTFGGGVRWSF